MNPMSLPIEIITALLGFILGFFAFVGEDILRRWSDKRSLRKKVLKNLISEAKENRANLEVSTWISLSKDAWNEAKNSGTAMDFKEELREKLIALYSRITEKNELLIYHRVEIEINQSLSVQDAQGQNPTSLESIIVNLSAELKEKINEIIPILEKELDC
jgi:hypothetical protein